MPAIRISAKAIIIRDGHLLVTRNLDAEGDFYLLPGGGQEHGEPLADALRRECLEEVGAHVSIGPLRFVRDYIGRNHEFAAEDPDAHQVELMFECAIEGEYAPGNGRAPDANQTGVVWLPVAALASARLYPAALRTLLGNVGGAAPVYLGDVN